MNKDQIEKAYLDFPKNFMTPEIRKWQITNDLRVVELSRGRALNGEDIYGVTEMAITEEGDLRTTDKGQMFYDKEQAHKYYLQLTF